MLSVMDFGAAGDGTTDDTAAIQAAIDATPSGNILSFPAKHFLTSAPVGKLKPIRIVGESNTTQDGGADATKIGGNFSGYVFSFPLAGIVSGFGIENVAIGNNHATGAGIYLSNAQASARLVHLSIDAYRAITLASANFSVLVSDVRLKGLPGFAANGWGIYTRGHTNIVNADVVGFDNGLRLAGAGIAVVGGRYEVNKTGAVLGTLDDGSKWQAADVSFSGFSMEANDIGIYIRDAANFVFSGFSIQGSTGSPSGQSQFGILADQLSQGVFMAGGPGGTFSKTAIRAEGQATFVSVAASNNYAGAPAWDVRSPQTSAFVNTNYPGAGTGSIRAADRVRGVKAGKNLRGINVPVAAGAAFVDVVFPNSNSGLASLASATAATDAASTLPAGTYYYSATILNEVGETTAGLERVATIAAGQRVDLGFYGLPYNGGVWKRRIYRGTAAGVYDGFFEMPLNSSAPYQDKGQAFTAKQTPAHSVNGADGTEPDAVYAISAAASWGTSVSVSNKTTTGFRVNFSTAPASDGTVDWMLLR